MIASHRQEFRQAGEPDTVTRDELKADDWYLAGLVVEYRNHGPHDEFPGPWRAYGDAATVRRHRGRGQTQASPAPDKR